MVKFLEDSGLLVNGVSETVKNEAKEQKGELPAMLLSTLGAIFVGNILVQRVFLTLFRMGEGKTAPVPVFLL